MTHFVKNANKCTQCSQHVATDNPRYCEFMETLERLFPETPHLLTEATEVSPEETNQTISVFMLGGDSTVLHYRPNMSVKDLKLLVQQRLGPLPEKQRLLYRDKELKVCQRKLLILFTVLRVAPNHESRHSSAIVTYSRYSLY